MGGASPTLRSLWALLSLPVALPGLASLPGASAPRQHFRKGWVGGWSGCACRKRAAAFQAERCRGKALAELEGAAERSSGGPRGPSERAAGGPAGAAAAPAERGGDGAPSRAGTGASAMFAGLQDLGVANGEDLKETLTNCTEPLKAIEQFQVGRGAEAGRSAREPGRGAGSHGERAHFPLSDRCVCPPG